MHPKVNGMNRFMFVLHPEIFNSPVLISNTEAAANETLWEFFTDNRLNMVRYYLWDMAEVCITAENEIFADHNERANLLQRVKDIEKVLEAALILSHVNNSSGVFTANKNARDNPQL
jgi:hypothetical protein